MQVSKRIKDIKEYYFSYKLREVNSMISEGKPIINLGIGNPDLPPPMSVQEALLTASFKTNTHGYQPYKGIVELRNSISKFYQKHYDVKVNPETEILPLTGSKEGVMHISMAFLDRGDTVLVPNPGYTTYTSVTKMLGATPLFYNLKEANNWFPDFDEIEQKDLSKVKLMWVNYPNMPTGVPASTELFKNLVAFAKKHQILIVNDNPYSFILNKKPLSILSVEGAKKVALELNSLSKTFNMAGWRIGMLLGDKANIDAILKIKSNMDSGMFYGIQKGAIVALESDKDWYENLNIIYNKRRKILWKIIDKLGYTYDKNTAGLFIWAKLPQGKKSEEVTDYLLQEKYIFVTPGSIFGTNGATYMRFSLCVDEIHLYEVLKRVKS